MTFREILHGKLRGIMGAAWPYLITYLLTSAAVAAWAEHESTPFLISFGAVTIALALLAGWLAGNLVAGFRSRSSWRGG